MKTSNKQQASDVHDQMCIKDTLPIDTFRILRIHGSKSIHKDSKSLRFSNFFFLKWEMSKSDKHFFFFFVLLNIISSQHNQMTKTRHTFIEYGMYIIDMI